MTPRNATRTTYAYDPAGQLTQILHRKTADNTALAWANYAYDPAGNRTSMTDSAGTHAYAYDDLHRLISAEHPSGSAVPTKNDLFDYDRAGNRLFDANITGYQYDAANRLIENSSFTYSYDGNGNQTHKISKATGEDTEYLYNSENQLIEVKVGTSSIARFQYDGLGRRIEKSTGTVENPSIIKYVYDNEDVLAMLDGQDNLIARFTQGRGIDEVLSAKLWTNRFLYFHLDVLKGPIGVTDSFAGPVQRISYESFGKPKFRNLSDPPLGDDAVVWNPYGLGGGLWDSEIELLIFRPRSVDPRIGRFVAEDPIGLGGGINFYEFVGGNPVRRVDPWGTSWDDVWYIVEIQRHAVREMNRQGRRLPIGTGDELSSFPTHVGLFTGYLNNAPGAVAWWTQGGRHHYNECLHQVIEVKSRLEKQKRIAPNSFDSGWTFIERKIRFGHQTIVAVSDDPNDPVIELDPWANQVRLYRIP